MPTRRRVSFLVALRTVFGVALLTAPRGLLAILAPTPPDRGAVAFARILGARHLVEAGALFVFSDRRAIVAGAAVDAVHAVTVFALALADRAHRRLALINTAGSLAFAAFGFRRTSVRR